MIKDYIKNIEFNLFKLFKKERALLVAEFNVKIDQFKIYTYKFLHTYIYSVPPNGHSILSFKLFYTLF